MLIKSVCRLPLSLAIAATLAAPAGLFAAPSPVLTAADEVSLNHASYSGAALHAGDLLQTSAQGTAVLSVGTARASFGHLTTVEIVSGAVRLNHGYLRVSGPLNVLQAGATATPASPATDYELIALAGGRDYLHVFSGKVRLSGVAQPMDVAAGSAVTFQTQAGAGAAGQTAGGAGGAGAAGAGTAAAAAGTAGMVSAVVVPLSIIAAVTAVTAVVVAKVVNSTPSQP